MSALSGIENGMWCRNLFASMADGGVWGVPRSGLVFQRRGEGLVLTTRMPWEEAMPLSAEALVEQQDADFALIRDQFAAVGITVTKGGDDG